jgi:hypothetical protein
MRVDHCETLTPNVHFVVLMVGNAIAAAEPLWELLLMTFSWPSVVYTRDILACDGFFSLVMLTAAPRHA